MGKKPIVMISSYPPRLCGIATFCEEAREFIQKANPDRDVLVISHTDGEGEGVFPIIDMSNLAWWRPVAKKIHELDPYAIHIEHEYGLYEHVDDRGVGDRNDGFLDMLEAINDYPTVVEPHTIHGRLRDEEANFVYEMSRRAQVVLFKCHYQKWRLKWTFTGLGWTTPDNIMVIPHGARPDKRWGVHEIPQLREELGLCNLDSCISTHLVGLIGWIQSNKRWDILLSMWEEIAAEISRESGEQWDLLAAGAMRDPHHRTDYEKWKSEMQILEQKGLAHYYEFIPRGDRIISLNKPYITSAPMEGLTAQTLESEGGLLFTTKEMLKKKVIRLACDEEMRMQLGNNLKRYLDEVVSWEVVAHQYNEAYELARQACKTGHHVRLPHEF
jgi:glycosyltransferase involved in cell wall biosynthesis